MTVKPEPTERTPTVGHNSYATQACVDERVRQILARRAKLDAAERAERDATRP